MEVNPLGLDVQEYVTPVTAVAPMEVELPLQIDLSAPADLLGRGLTVITTVSLLVHPLLVFVLVK